MPGTIPDIEDKIHKARKAAYAMMGAGFHGFNGLCPDVSLNITNTYHS